VLCEIDFLLKHFLIVFFPSWRLASWTSSSSSDVAEADVKQQWLDVNWPQPSPCSHPAMNGLLRDLNLPKQSAKLLATRLQKRNFVEIYTSFSFYRKRETELTKCFQTDPWMLQWLRKVSSCHWVACISFERVETHFWQLDK